MRVTIRGAMAAVTCVLAAAGCGSEVNIVSGGTGAGGGTGTGGGGGNGGGSGGAVAVTSTSQGGGGGLDPTTNGVGAGPPQWEHNCADTGIGVDGIGAAVLLDDACEWDFWAKEHYDGATAYEVSGGVLYSLDARACGGGPDVYEIRLSFTMDGPGSYPLDWGTYQHDSGQILQLVEGTLDVTVAGDEGYNIEGSYDALFSGADGEPVQLSGPFVVCHLPLFPAP